MQVGSQEVVGILTFANDLMYVYVCVHVYIVCTCESVLSL